MALTEAGDHGVVDDHRQKDIRFHATIAGVYDYLTVEPREFANELLFGDLNRTVPTGALMIDLGCGTGHMLERFGERFDKRIGVDHSAEMLAEARAKLGAAGLEADFVQDDVHSFLQGYPGPPADFVSAVGFLHHLQPTELSVMLRSIHRVLRAGGRLLVAEPVRAPHVPRVVRWINAHSVLPERLEQVLPASIEEPDEEPLEVEVLTDALEDSGFCALRVIRGYDLLHLNYPPAGWEKALFRLLRRWHRNRGGDVIALTAEKPDRQA